MSVTDVVPEALAPTAMLPLAAVDVKVKLVVDERTPVVPTLPAADRVRAPPVAVNPELLMSVLLLTVPEPRVPDTARTAPEFVMVVAPVSFRTMVEACVARLPTAPLPPLTLMVGAITEPAVWVMVPVPVEVSVTEAMPVALAPRATLPLTAVDLMVRFVVDETTPLVLKLPAAERVSAPAVAVSPAELMSVVLVIVPEPSVPDTATAAPELLTLAEPVLLKTRLLA